MWYYADAGQQKGPISEADLEALYSAGSIQAQTLVWREGMSNWAAYAEAKGPGAGSAGQGVIPDGVLCVECGKMFPPDEVIRYGEASVCATCKPVFIQRIKEGVAQPGTFNYAGFWIRFGAKFVDGIILRVCGFFIGLVVGIAVGSTKSPQASLIAALIGMGIGILVNAIYCTVFVGAFGATPGKMAAKIRIVNVDGSKVSYGKACARYFAEILSSLTLGIGYIMAAFDDEKRALHDRICGTRVIRNS